MRLRGIFLRILEHGPAPRTALIVDDDPAIRALLSALLRQADFAVRLADSAGDARRQARLLEHPRLIVCDVELGEDDGLALAARLKEQHPRALVVVISAKRLSTEQLRRATAIGRFVPKGRGLLSALLDIANEATTDVEGFRFRDETPPRREGR